MQQQAAAAVYRATLAAVSDVDRRVQELTKQLALGTMDTDAIHAGIDASVHSSVDAAAGSVNKLLLSPLTIVVVHRSRRADGRVARVAIVIKRKAHRIGSLFIGRTKRDAGFA